MKPPFKQAYIWPFLIFLIFKREFASKKPEFFKTLVKLTKNIAQDLQVLNISDLEYK